MRSLYAEHRRLGGRRASLLLPVVIIGAPVLAAAAVYSIVVFSREID